MQTKHTQTGFTLIEISIVLVIVGLLAVSILAGRYLTKQAELKSIIESAENYKDSLHSFREKYAAWPGDMPNATDYWTGTVNGNGNDQIIGDAGGPSNNEGYRAWQHLVLAKMVNGNFNGLGRGTGNEAIIGENVPKSPRDSGGYFLHYEGIPNHYNALNLGAATPGTVNFSPVLSADDAYHIDMKADDGLPRSGNIWAGGNGGAGNCYTGTSYNLTEDSVECAFHFWIDGR